MRKSRSIIFYIMAFAIGAANVVIWDYNQVTATVASFAIIFPLAAFFTYCDSKEKGEL